jgi:hypothetical protein
MDTLLRTEWPFRNSLHAWPIIFRNQEGKEKNASNTGEDMHHIRKLLENQALRLPEKGFDYWLFSQKKDLPTVCPGKKISPGHPTASPHQSDHPGDGS